MDQTWDFLTSDWYSTSRALAAIILEDGTAIDLGDSDTISANFTPSSSERYRKNTATRVLGKKTVNQTAIEVSLTLTQLNPIMRVAQWMGTPGQYLEQAAAEGAGAPEPVEVEDYELGRIVILPNFAFNATITAVTLGGTPVTADKYRFDKMAGAIQVPRSEGLEDGDLVIAYTLPAIAATEKRFFTAIGGQGVRGGLIVRQVNAEGPRSLVRFSPGLFLPTNVALVGGDELDTHEFTFSPEADAQGVLGRVLDISDAVLAI